MTLFPPVTRIGDFESDVNAVFRPRFEAATTKSELLAVAQAWLDAGAAYAYAHGWPQRDVDNLRLSIEKQVQAALPFVQEGLAPTLANRWNAFVANLVETDNPARTGGRILMAVGFIVAGLAGVAVAGRLLVPKGVGFSMRGVTYDPIPE